MNLYSARAEERRKQFNRIINGCDMVLMNNIPEVDPSVWENWEGKSPLSEECEISEYDEPTRDGYEYRCLTHNVNTHDEYECDEYEGATEVYQWFAVSSNDAEFLKRHNQYITYSDMLDTHFLAICHYGTSWDYTQMVDDFEDCYHGLDKLDDQKEVI